MEQLLVELAKQGASFALLAVVLIIMFRQQERREERAEVERKETREIFTRALDRISEQVMSVVNQLTLLTSNLTSAIEQSRADHDAMHRAHNYQHDEHKEILKLLQGGKK